MLSRVHDTRVFTGSHDVVYSEATERDAHERLAQLPSYTHDRQQRLGAATADDANASSDSDSSEALRAAADSDDSADEYEYFRDSRHPPSAALHPHHPYNAQLRALASSPRTAGIVAQSSSSSSKRKGPSVERAPMEFVYLPSGEIRPRDECPPGLLLPPPASTAPHAIAADAFSRDRRHGASRAQQRQRSGGRADARSHRAPASVSSDASLSSSSASEAAVAAPVRRRPDSNRHTSHRNGRRRSHQRQVETLSELASDSDDDDVSEDDSADEDDALDEKENVQQQQTQRGRSERHADKRPPPMDRPPVVHMAKHESERVVERRPHHRQATLSASERQRRGDTDDPHSSPVTQQEQEHSRRRISTASRQIDQEPALVRKRATSTAASKQEQSQPPPAPSDAHAPRPRATKSTKLDVRDLLSDHAPPLRTPAAQSASSSAGAAAALRKQVAELERALQSEKQRVLETMTQVLDAQRTAQDRTHDVARLEAQLAAKDHETERRVQDAAAKEQAHWSTRVSALETAVQSKDAAVARLQSTVQTLQDELQQARMAAVSRPSPTPPDHTTAQQQMEKIVAKLRKFHARVERWKRSSRAATDVCATPADVASLLDALWRDFPALPLRDLVVTNGSGEAAGDSSCGTNAQEPAHMLAFLTKRLRLREDELAQTHAKYGELKELCARQCVREADLQNFINEHRLRGNLVIRNTATAAADDGTGASDDRRKTVQFHAQGGGGDEQQQQRTRERSGCASTSRATNTPPVYFAAADEDGGDDSSGDGASGDDGGRDVYDREEDEVSEAQSAYLVREPKVFVQVGRDGVYERAGASSAMLRKLEDERMRQQLASRSSARPSRDVERIRLVPSPALARRYERVPAASETHTTRRKAPSAAATPVRSSARSVRQPPSISATRSANGAARRRAAQQPPPLPRANGSVRSGSVTSSRNSRTVAAPWV